MRKSAVFTLCAALLLSACDKNSPTPSGETRGNIESTSFDVSTVKQSLTVDGCEVRVHRVHTARKDLLNPFTIATAKCPTATVVSTEQNCGKSCVSNIVTVTSPATPAPGQKSNQALKKEAEKKLFNERIDQLTKELEAELEALKREQAAQDSADDAAAGANRLTLGIR